MLAWQSQSSIYITIECHTQVCLYIVDVMPLFNYHDGSYILIKLLRLIGENVMLRDKMSNFHLNILNKFCTNFLRDEASTFYSIYCLRKNGHS